MIAARSKAYRSAIGRVTGRTGRISVRRSTRSTFESDSLRSSGTEQELRKHDHRKTNLARAQLSDPSYDLRTLLQKRDRDVRIDDVFHSSKLGTARTLRWRTLSKIAASSS